MTVSTQRGIQHPSYGHDDAPTTSTAAATTPAAAVTVAIVAHPKRRAMAINLARRVGANEIFWDDTNLGPQRNALRAWRWQAQNCTPNDWAVVLEDDAQPVDGFGQQLEAALAATPAPVVGLYLGRNTPTYMQDRIASAVTRAGAANWIMAQRIHNAVGVAVLGDLVGSLAAHLGWNSRPVDEAIGMWASAHHHPVAYTWPSLVDHADEAPIGDSPRRNHADQPRKAWSVGTREVWTRAAVTL